MFKTNFEIITSTNKVKKFLDHGFSKNHTFKISGSNLRVSFEDLSLAKLTVSHDLLCSTVTNKIAFDQRDSKSISNFERAMDRSCQALVSLFLWFPNWKPWISSVLTN